MSSLRSNTRTFSQQSNDPSGRSSSHGVVRAHGRQPRGCSGGARPNLESCDALPTGCEREGEPPPAADALADPRAALARSRARVGQ